MQQTVGHDAATASIPIRGADGVCPGDLHHLLSTGGHRCVRFEYCVSVVVATFHYQTATCLTDSARTRFLYGLSYSVMALAFGPWGMPWGPILTAHAVWVNLSGGTDVTSQILYRLESDECYRPREPTGSGR